MNLMRCGRDQAVALVAAVTVALGTGLPIRASDAADARSVPRSCPSPALARLVPPGSHLELFVAAGDTIPSGFWPYYRALALDTVACAAPGDILTVRPVTAATLASPPLLTIAVPTEDPRCRVNPDICYAAGRAFAATVDAAVETLPRYRSSHPGRTDPLGALMAAGDDFGLDPDGTRHVIVIIANGWVQSELVNIYQYQHDPSVAAPQVIEALRTHGVLPDLIGADVILAGVTSVVPSMDVSDLQLHELCAGFWRPVVQAARGHLRSCGVALPGVGLTPSGASR